MIKGLTETHISMYNILSNITKNIGNCQLCVFSIDDPDFTEVEDDCLFVCIGGGHNGGKPSGNYKENWEEYFDALSKLVRIASGKGLRLWMVDAGNDCLDDMFTIRFGVRTK